MSRHRNIRNLTEDDYYDEYDDDDYYYDEDYYDDDDDEYYKEQQQQQQRSSYESQQQQQEQKHSVATTSTTASKQQQQLSLVEKMKVLTDDKGVTHAQAKTALDECHGNIDHAIQLLKRATKMTTTTKPPSSSSSTVGHSAIATTTPTTTTTTTVANDGTEPLSRRKQQQQQSLSLSLSSTVDVVDQKQQQQPTTITATIPHALRQRIEKQKSQLSMVVLGHVDAGKSTLMGQLLLQLGLVTKRTVDRYHREASEVGKSSFYLSWIMDEDDVERRRGVTMDVATKHLATARHDITVLDAPGHADFVPNMITGASLANVAVLVVAAPRGEFDAGFGSGGSSGGASSSGGSSSNSSGVGQTREHIVLARGLGVSQLIVAVNKLDAVDWSRRRFEEIRDTLRPYLVAHGFPTKRIVFVPTSGLTGINVTTKPDGNSSSDAVTLSQWYDGPTLLEAIDAFQPAHRNIDKPLRIIVTDVFMDGKSVTAKCRVVQGVVQTGDRLVVLPIGDETVVSRIGGGAAAAEALQDFAMAGDTVDVALANIDLARVTPGCILSHTTPTSFRPAVRNRMKAKILVMEQLNVPIIRGAQVLFHMHSIDVPAVISKLIAITKHDGTIQKERPRVVTGGASALVEITLQEKVCLEAFADCRALGRFVLRRGGDSIAVGIIEEVL